MDGTSLEFIVSGSSPKEENILVNELESLFLAHRAISKTSRSKINKTTMDLGSVLTAILALPVATELAKGPLNELARGIADWMRKRRANIVISGNEIRFENVRQQDVLAVLTKLLNETPNLADS